MRKIESALSNIINAAYAGAINDKQAIEVIPSANPKPADPEHEAALAMAKKRIGHLTGSLHNELDAEPEKSNEHSIDELQ